MKKKLTVIIPVYKVEAYIAATVQSLLGQTFKDFELVIVDDGSPDNSATIAESLLLKSELDYQVIHTDNRGVSAARNTGLSVAKGDYVIMVDGDDVLTPDFLAYYANLLKQYPEADVYSTSFTIYSGDTVIEQPKLNQETVIYTSEDALLAFYNRNPRFLLPTLMLSNEFVHKNNIRFEEKVRYSEDVQFIWRVLAYNTKELIHSSYSGYKYILHPGSTMTASGVQKILTWCTGFNQLDKDIHAHLPEAISNTFVPMSYFAMLHGASKMLSYNSFMEVYKQAGCEKYLKFGNAPVSKKVKIVTNLINRCPYIGYNIMKHF